MRKSIRTATQQKLQELLIEARKAAKKTQAEVARRLGKPQSFVAKYERGERRLDVVEFLSVAAAIGCDPIQMMRTLLKDTPQ